MSFTLLIEFSGLCMFVPRAHMSSEDPPDRMNVLLPCPEHEHGADRHVAVLAFDSALLTADASSPNDSIVLISLDNLDLHVPGEAPNLLVCPEIANLRDVTLRPVDPTLLGANPNPSRLLSRVQLNGGEMVSVDPGKCWEWIGAFRNMAFRVRWQVDYPADESLQLVLADMSGEVERTIELHPLPGASEAEPGVIFIRVLHVPAGDLPPNPETDHHVPPFGYEPEHFRSFFKLFGGAVPVVLPKFWGAGDFCGPPVCPTILGEGGSPFNCIVSSDY